MLPFGTTSGGSGDPRREGATGPLTRYGDDVHYGLTRRWAESEGFAPEAAEEIAVADLDVDEDYPSHEPRHYGHHFPAAGSWFRARRYLATAIRERSLRDLGVALHIAQDTIAHGLLGHVVFHRCDVWEERTPRVHRRTEALTRRFLRRYLDEVVPGRDNRPPGPVRDR